MKRIFGILIVPLALAMLAGSFFAMQSFTVSLPDGDDDEKKIRIKMIRMVDGVETVIDTTITINDDIGIDKILQGLNLDSICPEADSIIQIINLDLSVEEEQIIKVCIKVEGDDENLNIDSLLNTIKINIGDSADGETKIITATFGNCGENKSSSIKKDVHIVKTTKDGKPDSKIEKKVIVIGGDGDNVEVHNLQGDNEHIELIMDENGEQKVIIKADCESGDKGEILIYNISDGDQHTEIRTKICIVKLDPDDISTLEKSGVNVMETGDQPDDLKLSFYPNPSKGKFTLTFELPQPGDTKIRIFDLKGNEVYKESFKNFKGFYNKEIDLSKKGKGTYLIHIEQEGQSYNKKIIIQ